MITKEVKSILPVSILLTLVLLFTSPVCALAQKSSPADDVNVLVLCKSQPGHSDETVVSDSGGKVKRSYHIVPAIAASVPRGKLEALKRNPAVVRIEEDTTVQITGQALPWGVDRIDAEVAHQSNKGTGVRVAILDTGIDLDHTDLRVAGGVSMLPDIPTADDDNGHGTLVAGIVAALDNGEGVVGVAPEAEIYAVKVLNQSGSGSLGAILAGIEWAVDNQMQVINMSIGSSMEWPTLVQDALQRAWDAGIVIVAGAGNGGNAEGTGDNIWAPGRYAPVIAVGATDGTDKRYSLSCTGATLELMAPGVNVNSTARGGGYGGISCTSAASPHAAGLAALLIASGITTNVEVRQALRNGARDLGAPGWDPQYGWGLINAGAVGAYVAQPANTTSPVVPEPVLAPAPTPAPAPAEAEVGATTTDGVVASSGEVSATSDTAPVQDNSAVGADVTQPADTTSTAPEPAPAPAPAPAEAEVSATSTDGVEPIVVETSVTSTVAVDSTSVETGITDGPAPADKVKKLNGKDAKPAKDAIKDARKADAGIPAGKAGISDDKTKEQGVKASDGKDAKPAQKK